MSFTSFNPTKVAQAEVGWWQAHNDHDMPRLKQSLQEWLRQLYGLSAGDAEKAVGYLAQAVTHHDGRSYQGTIELIDKYYTLICQRTDTSFNPRKAAELEVGWWQLHDELEHEEDKSRLAQKFASLYAELYGIDSDLTAKVGALKAEATREHDMAEDEHTPSYEVDQRWDKARVLLESCYRELSDIL